MPDRPIIGVITTVFEWPTCDAVCEEIRRRGGLVLGLHGLVEEFAAVRLGYEIVDGWVVIMRPDHIERLRETGRPVVLVGGQSEHVDSVRVDNIGGTRAIMRHLLDQGHTQIAYIGYGDVVDVQERYETYRQELEAAGLPYTPALVVEAPGDMDQHGYLAAQQLIDSRAPFSAIYVPSDWLAIGVLRCLKDNSLRVPDDVALVSFDDLSFVRYTDPPISAAHQDFGAVGARAVALLFERLGAPTAAPAVERIPAPLMIRESSLRSGRALPIAPQPAAAADWQSQLAQDLAAILIAPQPWPAQTTPEQIWPGVARLVQSLADLLAGQWPAPLDQIVWAEAWQRISDPTRIGELIDRMQIEAILRMPERSSALAAQVTEWLRACRSIADSHRLQELIGQESRYHAILDTNLALTNEINDPTCSPMNLGWLRSIESHVGALLRWRIERGAQPGPGDWLQFVTAYSADGGHQAIDEALRPAQIPPRGWVEAAYAGAHQRFLKLLTITRREQPWGYLLYCEALSRSQIETIDQRRLLISAAIEREELVQDLTERQGILQKAYQREQDLTATIRELGCPLIPLIPGVLLVPLIGTIDDQRAGQIIETILEGVSKEQASHVLLDITGVPMIDTQVAAVLIRTAQAVGLLGARVIMVGVRPEIAQSIVSLGIDLGQISTHATLAVALHALLQGKSR